MTTIVWSGHIDRIYDLGELPNLDHLDTQARDRELQVGYHWVVPGQTGDIVLIYPQHMEVMPAGADLLQRYQTILSGVRQRFGSHTTSSRAG